MHHRRDLQPNVFAEVCVGARSWEWFQALVVLHGVVKIERNIPRLAVEIDLLACWPLVSFHENNQCMPLTGRVAVGPQQNGRGETAFAFVVAVSLCLCLIPPFVPVHLRFARAEELNDGQAKCRTISFATPTRWIFWIVTRSTCPLNIETFVVVSASIFESRLRTVLRLLGGWYGVPTTTFFAIATVIPNPSLIHLPVMSPRAIPFEQFGACASPIVQVVNRHLADLHVIGRSEMAERIAQNYLRRF